MSQQLFLGHQATQRVMGVTTTITVHAPHPFQLAERGFSLLRQLEYRWSRFVPQSDISRLNNAGGAPVEVATETVDLIAHMITAHRVTDGRFNPTLLPRHRDSHDLASLVDDKRCIIPNDARAWNSLDDITINSSSSVTLPPTMTLDAGGIGKGFAADLVVDDLVSHGAQSVSVNIGGDARVTSIAPFHESWNFDIIDSHIEVPISTISLLNGAIATSSLDARYRHGRGPEQHIFSTLHESLRTRTCSVIAPLARWAEVWTKCVVIADAPMTTAADHDLIALTVDHNGNISRTNSWKEFEL